MKRLMATNSQKLSNPVKLSKSAIATTSPVFSLLEKLSKAKHTQPLISLALGKCYIGNYIQYKFPFSFT